MLNLFFPFRNVGAQPKPNAETSPDLDKSPGPGATGPEHGDDVAGHQPVPDCKRRGGNRAARGRNMPLLRPTEKRSARVRARRSGSRKAKPGRKTRLSGQRGQRQPSRMRPGWSSRLVNLQRKKSNEEAGGEGGSRPHVAARIQLHPSRLGSVGSVACLARLGEGRPRREGRGGSSARTSRQACFLWSGYSD